jgi:hypothetical protein
LTMLNRRHVVEFANINRLPTIFESGAVVRDGRLRALTITRPRTAAAASALNVAAQFKPA